MLRCLRIVPPWILNSCDLIRRIRNEFAHHLAYKRLDQLDDKWLRKLAPSVQEFNCAERNRAGYRALLAELIGFALLALHVYAEQATSLRAFIESSVGRRAFKEWAESGVSG